MIDLDRPKSGLLLGAVLAVLASASGCSLFRADRRLDMGPFGENTVSMVGEMQKFNRPALWVHLKKYQAHPAVHRVVPEMLALRRLLRGIGAYSMQIAALSDSRLSEGARLRELARYLRETVRPALLAEGDPDAEFPQEALDQVIHDVLARETFFEGLAAAQPMVNAALEHGLRLLDRFDDRVGEAALAINREIEQEFAPLKRNITELEKLQQRAMEGVTLLYRYRLGDDDALAALRLLYPPVAAQLPPGQAPSARQLEAAELAMVAQLHRIKELKEQLAPEFAIYKESQRELEVMRLHNEERARLGRATLALWARSHKNLGLGVPVPPAIDVMAMLRAASGTAAGTAVKLVPGL